MRKSVYKVFLFVIFLFLYAPIIILMINSFNVSKSRAIWGGFTFKWYGLLFKNMTILQALENTMIIAFVSTIIATILGTLSCVGLINSKKYVQSFLIKLSNIPIINPEIVVGVSSMIFFVMIYRSIGLFKPGLFTLIITHSTFCIPYVFLSVLPKMKQVNLQILEAARDLGCTYFQSFFKVLLPEIMPGIVTGAIMSFTMSIDDFTISYFTSGNIETLPIAIYSMTKKSVTPEINALSTIFFFTILFLLTIINLSNEDIEWI